MEKKTKRKEQEKKYEFEDNGSSNQRRRIFPIVVLRRVSLHNKKTVCLKHKYKPYIV